MGTYELSCADRDDCTSGGHIANVGVVRKKEFQSVDVSVARLMLSSGDTLYVRDPETNNRIGIRKGKCDCGAKTVRTDIDASRALDHLQSCG